MVPIEDPQVATLLSNVRHLTQNLEKMQEGQERIETAVMEVALIQNELSHFREAVSRLTVLAESRGHEHHSFDKRILVLERWHKFMLAQPVIIMTLGLAALSYFTGFVTSVEDFHKDTTRRLYAVEFIVNSEYRAPPAEAETRPYVMEPK